MIYRILRRTIQKLFNWVLFRLDLTILFKINVITSQPNNDVKRFITNYIYSKRMPVKLEKQDKLHPDLFRVKQFSTTIYKEQMVTRSP